jgi:hypothetical protein
MRMFFLFYQLSKAQQFHYFAIQIRGKKGMYFNLFLIYHSILEFIAAFINLMLGVLKVKVISRIRVGIGELQVEEKTPIQLKFDTRVQV